MVKRKTTRQGQVVWVVFEWDGGSRECMYVKEWVFEANYQQQNVIEQDTLVICTERATTKLSVKEKDDDDDDVNDDIGDDGDGGRTRNNVG